MLDGKSLFRDQLLIERAAMSNETIEEFFKGHQKELLEAKGSRNDSITKLGFTPSHNSIYNFFDINEMTAVLKFAKVYKIDDKFINLFLNTDVDIKDIRLPFHSLYLDANIKITEDIYVSGIFIRDLLNKDNERDETFSFLHSSVKKQEEVRKLGYTIYCQLVNIKTGNTFLCCFNSISDALINNKMMTYNQDDLSTLQNIFMDINFRKKISYFIYNFLKLLYNPEVEICEKTYSPIGILRNKQQGKIVENHYYLKITGKLREYIDLIDSTKFQESYLKNNNSWIVRGFYRKLTSNFYKNMQGQEIFIPPFICGLGKPKDKYYLVADKLVYRNQLVMINIIKGLFPNHLVLTNTRVFLDGLEIDCYIPDLKLGFEYNGKQHYELVEYFHKEENSLRDIIKRDIKKNILAKEKGITLITIKYDEILSKELILDKLKDSQTKIIIKIESVGMREVFDISVEDNNNFYLKNKILSENSGKSTCIVTIAQGYHDNHDFKIIDLDGGPRNEGVFWTLPSLEEGYWNKIGLMGTFDEAGPKQYPVSLIYPYFESKLPKRLPKKIINGEVVVKSKLFTIPIRDIDIKDVTMVIGNLSDTSEYGWSSLMSKINKKDNSGSIMPIISKVRGVNSTPLVRNFLEPLSREKFLADSYAETNLDLIEEFKDRKTITVLCLDFVPDKFKLFVINYICRKTMEYLDLNKIPRKNLLLMREASRYFKASNESILPDELKLFKDYMSDYIRMGRRGAYFLLDTQSSSETRGLVQGQEDFTIMFRVQSWRDKAELTEEMKKEKRIRQDQINDLAFLEKGQAYVAPSGKVVKKVQFIMPRTAIWKKEYGNFYRNMWEKHGGEWQYTAEIKDNINNKFQELHDLRSEKQSLKEKNDIAIEKDLITPLATDNNPIPEVKQEIKKEETFNSDTNEIVEVKIKPKVKKRTERPKIDWAKLGI